MTGNFTFTIIKPCAFQSGHTGDILAHILRNGFRLSAMKLIHMTEAQAMQFYAVHKERPFYKSLCEFMSSGPVVVAVLSKENAVEDFRKLIGATNPANAAEGTIRKIYAKSLSENAVHGSDSDENAAIEAAFFFSGTERV